MAVAQMKKLSVVALEKDTQRLITELQKLKCVEVSENDFAAVQTVSVADISQEMGELLSRIASTRRAIAFLAAYETGKHTIFDPPMEASISLGLGKTLFCPATGLPIHVIFAVRCR